MASSPVAVPAKKRIGVVVAIGAAAVLALLALFIWPRKESNRITANW